MLFQFSSILLLVVVASQELRACFVAPYLNKSRRDDNSCLSRPQSYHQQGSDFARASVPHQKKVSKGIHRTQSHIAQTH